MIVPTGAGTYIIDMAFCVPGVNYATHPCVRGALTLVCPVGLVRATGQKAFSVAKSVRIFGHPLPSYRSIRYVWARF